LNYVIQLLLFKYFKTLKTKHSPSKHDVKETYLLGDGLVLLIFMLSYHWSGQLRVP